MMGESGTLQLCILKLSVLFMVLVRMLTCLCVFYRQHVHERAGSWWVFWQHWSWLSVGQGCCSGGFSLKYNLFIWNAQCIRLYQCFFIRPILGADNTRAFFFFSSASVFHGMLFLKLSKQFFICSCVHYNALILDFTSQSTSQSLPVNLLLQENS